MAGVVTRTTLSGGVAVSAYSAFSGIKAVASADYTILDDDGYTDIHVTTGASDRTVTPPAAANNSGRRIRFLKVDSGAGGVAIAGTISGSSSNNTIKKQYGYAEIISNGTAWYWVVDIQESGTWTPVPTYTGGTGSIGAINLQTGAYRRNGRNISWMADVSWRAGTVAGAAVFTIAGLPFSCSVGNTAVAIGYNDQTTMASGAVLYAAVTSTSVAFYTKAHSGAATTMASATVSTFANTGSDNRAAVSGSYPIA